MITLHNLPSPNNKAPAGRVGRGIAAGQGKTAGRGTKGQKSRSGFKRRISLPNMPKLKGFKSHRKRPKTINWDKVVRFFKSNEKPTQKNLFEKGLLDSAKQQYKIVGKTKPFSAANIKSTEPFE